MITKDRVVDSIKGMKLNVVGRGEWVDVVGRGEWVDVVGRGSWVWVNVVGKNKIILAKYMKKISIV